MTTRKTKSLVPASPPRRRRIVESVLLVVGVVVLLDALFGERGLVEGIGNDQELHATQARLAKMREDNATLADEIRRLSDEDPATIEDAARDLEMVKPGEKLIKIRDVKPAGQ